MQLKTMLLFLEYNNEVIIHKLILKTEEGKSNIIVKNITNQFGFFFFYFT